MSSGWRVKDPHIEGWLPKGRLPVALWGTPKKSWKSAIAAGFAMHDVPTIKISKRRENVEAEFFVIWGWRQAEKVRKRGFDVLVMERGYVGNREEWISLGWNGLNGRALFPVVQDGGQRWRSHFEGLEKPWRSKGKYVLLIGQVSTDAALFGVNIYRWYNETIEALRRRYRLPVLFRPHPIELLRKLPPPEVGVPTLSGSLDDALKHAAVVVTYNSNVGVDAALAGVPVIACDKGSMAWPVAAHGLKEDPPMPDRADWLASLAWTQWTETEVRSGLAWEALKGCRP